MFKTTLNGLLLISFALSQALHAAESVELVITDHKGQPLADAVVTLKPIDQNLAIAVPGSASIAQIDREFVPKVSVVPVGTSISFPNKDNILHHVYSFSKVKTFDLPLYKGTPAEPVAFPDPGLVTLGCNIHDWMKAYVVVVDTPYFKVSDAAGLAKVIDLPLGNYELEVWHPRQRKAYTKMLDLQSPVSESISITTKPQLRSPKQRLQQSNSYN